MDVMEHTVSTNPSNQTVDAQLDHRGATWPRFSET